MRQKSWPRYFIKSPIRKRTHTNRSHRQQIDTRSTVQAVGTAIICLALGESSQTIFFARWGPAAWIICVLGGVPFGNEGDKNTAKLPCHHRGIGSSEKSSAASRTMSSTRLGPDYLSGQINSDRLYSTLRGGNKFQKDLQKKRIRESVRSIHPRGSSASA